MSSRTAANYRVEAIAAAVTKQLLVERGNRVFVVSVRQILGGADLLLIVGDSGNAIRMRQGNRFVSKAGVDAGMFVTTGAGITAELLIVYSDDGDLTAPAFDLLET